MLGWAGKKKKLFFFAFKILSIPSELSFIVFIWPFWWKKFICVCDMLGVPHSHSELTNPEPWSLTFFKKKFTFKICVSAFAQGSVLYTYMKCYFVAQEGHHNSNDPKEYLERSLLRTKDISNQDSLGLCSSRNQLLVPFLWQSGDLQHWLTDRLRSPPISERQQVRVPQHILIAQNGNTPLKIS